MDMIVYFDQNALSDLRERKRKDKEEFRNIYDLIVNRKFRVRYSSTHLDEIRNISKLEYQEEHIDTLCEIKARYVSTTDGVIDIRSPWTIWNEYLDREQNNEIDGSNSAYFAAEKLGKKISGIPMSDGFTDLHEQMQNIALSLVMKAEESLLSLTHEELAFEGTSASEIKSHLAETKNRALAMNPISVPENVDLGPRAFREWLQQAGVDVNKMQAGEVITQIDELFLKVSGNRIDQEYFYDESILSRINRSYNLMNWAGYYPDDFTKVKKGKDRFRASWNDMNHVAHASGYTYLVSSDERFSKKAEACYAHLGVSTNIVTPKDLVRHFL